MISNAPLKRTSPESQGVSSRALLELIRGLDRTENEIHGFMVARNECVIAESWLAPYDAKYPHTCHSLGKSYTCTAVGLACTEGLLDPEDKIVDLLKEEIETYGVHPDENFKKIKLRDVMAMANGMPSMAEFNESWLENYLNSQVVYEPGTKFLYNTVGACLLGAIAEKAVGKGILEYLREKLFCKIGIGEDDLVWLQFPNGIYAEPGVSATTESNLRLGLFYLANGMAEGEQIVSPQWMKQATSKQVDTPGDNLTSDYQNGYGWQLWMSSVPGMYRFDGGQGQFCFMAPDQNTVIAIHEGGKDPLGVQKVIDLSQKFITDMGDKPLPEDPEAWDELKAYLVSRCLPDEKIAAIPNDAGKFDGIYNFTEGDANFWIEVIPVGEDFYHLFYDNSITRETKTIELRYKGDHIMMTVNGKSEFKLWLDGRREAFDTYNVIPQLSKTCSNAYFENENTLVVTVKWLNGWMESKSVFKLEGCELAIDMEKDMLHETKKSEKRYGNARKIGM